MAVVVLGRVCLMASRPIEGAVWSVDTQKQLCILRLIIGSWLYRGSSVSTIIGFFNLDMAYNIFGPAQAGCALEACLADYTKLELLTDCICRKCSLLATHKRLAQEAERLAEAMNADPDASMSKKRRVKEAKKLETKVKLALEEGRIEDDIKGVKMDKVFSKASTKQAMIARVSLVFMYSDVHFTNLFILASSCACTAFESFNTLRPLCSQEANIRIIFPEISGLNIIHHIWQPLHNPLHTHLNPTAIHPTKHNTHSSDLRYTTHHLPTVSRRLPLRSTLLRAIRVCYRRKPRRLSTGTARVHPSETCRPTWVRVREMRAFRPGTG